MEKKDLSAVKETIKIGYLGSFNKKITHVFSEWVK